MDFSGVCADGKNKKKIGRILKFKKMKLVTVV